MMGTSPYDSDREWDDSDQLDLAEDDSLPWLDAGEDDEAAGGFDVSRMVMLGVLALVALGVVVGGIWFVANTASDEPPADGSLIAAPEEPYKTRPDDEGGKVFPGTGDTSFAVGEGQTREGRLADKPASAQPPAPSIASTIDEAPRETKVTPTKVQPQVSGVPVQVGAFPRREDAEAAWVSLTRQTEALSGVRHRVVEAQVDIGRVYRLQAMAGDRASANRLCNALQTDGLACFVK